jgi:hypothetical protein
MIRIREYKPGFFDSAQASFSGEYDTFGEAVQAFAESTGKRIGDLQVVHDHGVHGYVKQEGLVVATYQQEP